MKTITLREVVQQHVQLDRPNNQGWHPVLCKVCNDSGRKGKRAGFKFDGGVVGYNCFNCAHNAIFDPATSRSMPQKMLIVLQAFGIPKVDWQPVLFTALTNENNPSNDHKLITTFTSIEPTEIQYPSFFIPLTDDKDNEWCQCAIEYLKDERGINWKDYTYLIVGKTNHPDNTRWYGRLIIPVFKNKKLIFYQGRDLTGLHTKKYLSPNAARENILSGYEHIFANTTDPLYITEGWFDSYHLKGVAVFGSKMTANQIKWINQSHRPKVVVPDKFGDGYLLAEQALELGWSVSLPDCGSMKDVNDAIMKYGQLYVQKTIREQTYSDFDAKARLGVYCERRKKEQK